MKIISFENIKSLNISPGLCYEWVEEMIRNKQKTVLPAKIHMDMPDNVFCNIMPGIISIPENARLGGVKVVTRYPKREPSLDSQILLFDAATGKYMALMDGNWITAMRTGAVAAHSILNFAKKGFRTIGMIGLGNTARASLLVLASKAKDKLFSVKLLRYKDQAELFVNRFAGIPNLEFSIVDTIEECIKGTEVVVSCATYFEDDIAANEYFEEGVLVVPVHTRGFMNCDLFFDKVYADDTGHVSHFRNFGKFKYYAEVSDVVNGRSVGRESNQERILAYNIGIAIHDIHYAARIYQMLNQNAEEFKKLPEVDMHNPIDKFWI